MNEVVNNNSEAVTAQKDSFNGRLSQENKQESPPKSMANAEKNPDKTDKSISESMMDNTIKI